MKNIRKNTFKAIILAFVLLACEFFGILLDSGVLTVSAASGGQTTSSDVLNVKLTTSGSTRATMGSLSESSYTSTNNTAGNQTGTIKLDNASVGGHMHVNIGQTIDMYAPAADVDYTDKIGFSGNYTFKAAGGMGGGIVASDGRAGIAAASGSHGSVITNSMIDYNTEQSITYRKGSNGRTVSISEATNTSNWNDATSTATLATFMGNVNGGLAGEAQRYRAWTAVGQVGTASYIQVNGSHYIVAGGGAPGAVLFECNNGNYQAVGVTGMHADITPDLPSGSDGFYNPSAPNMTARYRDYDGTSNINAGRIAGVTMKNGVPVSNGWGGGVQYEDVFYGWVSNAYQENKGLSKVYPGYSGLAARDGNKFNPNGLSDATYNVSIDTGATQSEPYLHLTCNAKYITINNPTRPGYTFAGWTCGNGVSVASNTGSTYRFKVTGSGATITANWTRNSYTVQYNGNGATSGSVASQSVTFDTNFNLRNNGFGRTRYRFIGWGTSPNSGVVYNAGQQVKNLTTVKSGVVTLYAQWELNTFELTVKPNTGVWENSTSDQKIMLVQGTTKEISNPTKEGYTFDGWTLSGTGSTMNGTTFTMGSTNATLTAKWKPNEYKITYEKGDTDDDGDTPPDTDCEYDQDVTLPDIGDLQGRSYVLHFDSNKGSGSSEPTIIDSMSGNLTASGWMINSGVYGFGTTLMKPNFTAVPNGVVTAEPYWQDVVLTDFNSVSRDGYTFLGWYDAPEGGNLVTSVTVPPATTAFEQTLYAHWEAYSFTLKFHPNDGTEETHIEDMVVSYDQMITLPDGANFYKKYTLDGVDITNDVLSGAIVLSAEGRVLYQGEPLPEENPEAEPQADKTAYASIFKGWALEDGKDTFIPQWTIDEMSVSDIIDAVGVMNQNGTTITLYAIWDNCPWIQAVHLYYTLEQAQSGFITDMEILSHASAYDREDGSPIAPGFYDNGTSFSIPDYAPADFTQFMDDGSCTENLTVVDSSGSEYAKQIIVYIVDTTPVEVELEGTTRFINEYYYNRPYENGGVAEKSVWLTEPEYVAVIQDTFENIRNDTPEETYYFTHEELLQMKDYLDAHGIYNTREEGALENFYQQFVLPNLEKLNNQ